MKTMTCSIIPLLLSLSAVAGCVNQPDLDTKELDERPAAAEPVVIDAAVRVEQAERALDVGRDIAAARATLEAVVADKSAPVEVRDRAALSLSRALELGKDSEGAVRVVEELLASHAGDQPWSGHDAAERRLRRLLTGKESHESMPHRPQEKVAPFAKVLAEYFPVKKGEPVDVTFLGFGGDSQESERLGTFHVGAALREKAEEACPLCETKTNIRAMTFMTTSWTSIPAMSSKIDRSLAVFYTHLGDPIPARYEKLLPAPMSEVSAHLQKGEGLVVARERAGAPPVILIAAPREAQLAEVEEALSMMKALPGSATVVKVSSSLKPGEIAGVVRDDGMPKFKACYEGLLKRSPGAAGRLILGFNIKADGGVDDLKLEPADGLNEASFQQCVSDITVKLRFPAAGASTSVKYPIQFTPGDD